MKIDKYYINMIDDITNGVSDREQLLIIKELVERLRAWNTPYYDSDVEQLYYESMTELLKIIDFTLNKEDEING